MIPAKPGTRTGKSAHPTNRGIPVAWALLPEHDGLRAFMQLPTLANSSISRLLVAPLPA